MKNLRYTFVALLALGVTAATVAVAEDLTVTTYYPSPRGVYNDLRTMGQTTLAEQSGNVGIGVVGVPAAKLDVNGDLIVSGPATLGNDLDVTGNSSVTGNQTVTGNSSIGGTLGVTGVSTLGTTSTGALTASSANVTGTIRIQGGSPAVGKVLTSDGAGNATWAYPTYAP